MLLDGAMLLLRNWLYRCAFVAQLLLDNVLVVLIHERIEMLALGRGVEKIGVGRRVVEEPRRKC